MRIPSLGREDHLEAIMATHSNILAWRILQSLVGATVLRVTQC